MRARRLAIAAPSTAAPSTAGFTLVEALAAVVLMGLVLSGLALATGQLMPQWARGLARAGASERLALAMGRLAADLSAVEFVPATREAKGPLFEGSAPAVTFVRTALGPNARPGLEIVRLAAAETASGAGLARTTAPLRPRSAQSPPPAFSPPVPLLGPAWRVSFSFAGRDGIWRDGWTAAEELPRAVRVVVREAASGRPLPLSTTVVIRSELPAACVSDRNRRGCDKPPTSASASGPTTGAGTGSGSGP